MRNGVNMLCPICNVEENYHEYQRKHNMYHPENIKKFREQEKIDFMTQSGANECISFAPKGYRDVIWCPYLNEPTFVEYTQEGYLECPNCNHNFEVATHKFICHIDNQK